MAGWSSLTYALVASCAFAVTAVKAHPAGGYYGDYEYDPQPYSNSQQQSQQQADDNGFQNWWPGFPQRPNTDQDSNQNWNQNWNQNFNENQNINPNSNPNFDQNGRQTATSRPTVSSLIQLRGSVTPEARPVLTEQVFRPQNNQSFGHNDPTSLSGKWGSNHTGPIIVTGVRERVALRKEIREMIGNHTEFSLFILALHRLQRVPQNIDTSYFALAGIHGAPYKAWDNVNSDGGDPNRGYCAHNDAMFLPWHRPYMALFEQLMWNHARDIVNELPEGAKKQRFQAARDATIPVETVHDEGQTIPNPLFSYEFTDLNAFSGIEYRWPGMHHTVRFPTVTRNPGAFRALGIDEMMKSKEQQWKQKVFKILAEQKDFKLAGTMAVQIDFKLAEKMGIEGSTTVHDSIEGVHGEVHVEVGTNLDDSSAQSGHMFPPEFAGFDPIFWLHHANTWGAKFTRPHGTPLDLNTPLKPFRKSANEFWTSADVADTKQFGYTYRETQNGNPKDTHSQIYNLYGRDTIAFRLRNAEVQNFPNAGNFNKRAEASSTHGKLTSQPSNGSIVAAKEKVVRANKYTDWVANVEVAKNALSGSFKIFAFLGQPTTKQTKWFTDKSLIGSIGIFASGNANDQIVPGSITLTPALVTKLVANQTMSLEPGSVIPYLLKNLVFKASVGGENTVVDQMREIRGLKISIAAAEVTLPASERDLPKYGEYVNKIDWIDVPAGKLTPISH
ncbi:hypothetical protein H072_9127 [Dactylellina haptotyla CBS 200.50]|uniref:tyrosinase n=1 Tax=Dactylellina haptotyla (strain CBS 200.50) TaxID=1284197 RepID=S8BPP4_DACHA|nr:hypothetical protein H072_9127 [Dactylellina haptotyla CBS 200.50]